MVIGALFGYASEKIAGAIMQKAPPAVTAQTGA
jgi:hypothetical protein